MKTSLRHFIATLALMSACGASAAEITTVQGEARNSHFPAVQKYAQVCLVNSLQRAVLVGTSWVGEARNMAWILPGEAHIYRFETTGPIPVPVSEGEQVANTVNLSNVEDLNIAFRERGLLTTFSQTNINVYFSYSKTDDCARMAQYQFVYLYTGRNVTVGLVPVATPPYIQPVADQTGADQGTN